MARRWLCWTVACMATWLGASSLVTAQISVPEDAQFVLQIDLQAIQQSRLGQELIKAGKEAAMEELSKHTSAQGAENPLDKVKEVLGFDPLTEIKQLVITSSDLEHPEKSMTLWLSMGKTTGNLEGLLLGLPNYESMDYGNHVIHSAKPDEDRIYGAVDQSKDGNHVIILSSNPKTVEQQLDLLGDGSIASKPNRDKSLAWDWDVKTLISAQLWEIPLQDLGEGPHANVAKRLKSLAFAISEIDDELDLRLNLETETEKQANQIRQMVDGLVAMIEFAQSIESEDEDLQQVAKLLKQAKSSVEGTSVRMKLRLPFEMVEAALREMN